MPINDLRTIEDNKDDLKEIYKNKYENINIGYNILNDKIKKPSNDTENEFDFIKITNNNITFDIELGILNELSAYTYNINTPTIKLECTDETMKLLNRYCSFHAYENEVQEPEIPLPENIELCELFEEEGVIFDDLLIVDDVKVKVLKVRDALIAAKQLMFKKLFDKLCSIMYVYTQKLIK